MRNFTYFLFIRTLWSLICAEAFASLQRVRTSLVVRDNWDVTVQLVGPGTELLTRVTGPREESWILQLHGVCGCVCVPARGASTSYEEIDWKAF